MNTTTARIQRLHNRQTVLRRLGHPHPHAMALGTASLVVMADGQATARALPVAKEALPLPLVSQDQVQAHLKSFADLWDREQAGKVWDECRHNVLQSVAGPFGLGQFVSAYDRLGGHVDTVHNARAGVYATEEEAVRYRKRGEYQPREVHGNRAYINANSRASETMKDGELIDAYTGRRIRRCDRHDPQQKYNLDHVVSAKEVHEDAGRVLAEIDTATLANRDSNLRATTATINKSKKAKGAQDFVEDLNGDARPRRERIAELRKKGESITAKERAELAKHRQLDRVDARRVHEADSQARRQRDREINRTFYTSGKFAKQTTAAACEEGARQSAQQAFGVVLVEFLSRLMHEIRDRVRHGQRHAGMLADLGARGKRIGKACMAKLRTALAALGKGFASGLFSSLANTLVNTFATTTKRVARMLREGAQSLVGALRVLVMPASAISWRERVHEASKILLAGAMMVSGLALEEWLSLQLLAVPWLAPLATVLVPVLLGAFTAIATTFAVYLLDKADLLGVVAQRRIAGVARLLDDSIAERERTLQRLAGGGSGGWLLLEDAPIPAASLHVSLRLT